MNRSLVNLYTADPQSNDLILPIGDPPVQVHFRFATSTYTNEDGYYQFSNLNVDSVVVMVLTNYPSHWVGWFCDSGQYWCTYGWYYYLFGFENMMHWLNPVFSRGPLSAEDEYRGALNIMSRTHTGVNYVAGLPDSYFPEKVVMWWDLDDDRDTLSAYGHEAITIGGQVYDLIVVQGWRYWEDRDEWDEDVLLHEYGHFVMDNYAALPPVGEECKDHQWHLPSGDECAYAEGWATFYSCACQDDPNRHIWIDAWPDGTPALYIDVELPTSNPQGTNVEGAVCASLWDIFDYNNDVDAWNWDENAGLWWQEIDEIWYTHCEAAPLGHFPYTVCDFAYVWAWKGYPTDDIWRNIFEAHGIGCLPTGVFDELASMVNSRPFLWPNYPNPFNPQTQIVFRISAPQVAYLRLYNTRGRVIRTLLDSHKDPGTYTIWWDGKDDSGRFVSAGIYFCQLVVGTFKQTRKFVVLK